MKAPYIIEACVDSFNAALEAERLGADQIELCGHLEVDGLTPDYSLIKQVKQTLKIPVKVIIRPRAGNFIYTESEILKMQASIAICRYIGVRGVVLGVLKKRKKALDIKTLKLLASVAYPMPLTIHKAIDLCDDPVEEIKKLKQIQNIKYVLTSGKCLTALEGEQLIKEMMKEGNGRIQIIPGGKITKDNLHRVHSHIGATIYHGRAII